jgi:hypothetical protein
MHNDYSWVDSYINHLRIARFFGDQCEFDTLINTLLKGIQGGYLPIDKFVQDKARGFELNQVSLSLIKKHILYEVMTISHDISVSHWSDFFIDKRSEFSECGIIFDEFYIFSKEINNHSATTLLGSSGGLVEGLIRSIYLAYRAKSKDRAEELCLTAATIMSMLNAADKLDLKFYYPIYYICVLSKQLDMISLLSTMGNLALKITKGDWIRSNNILRLISHEGEELTKRNYMLNSDRIQKIYDDWCSACLRNNLRDIF